MVCFLRKTLNLDRKGGGVDLHEFGKGKNMIKISLKFERFEMTKLFVKEIKVTGIESTGFTFHSVF